MVMLALDTCLDGCSAALFGADGATVLSRRFETMQRGHAERLPVMVQEVLREAGVAASQLTRVAVTRGPGTFTGLRIGLSYAKGLGLALSIPVTGIDSLLATAVPHAGKAKRIAVAHTAGGTGLFYAALYHGENLNVIAPPALLSDDAVRALAQDALVIGTAAHGKELPDAAAFGAYALALPDQGAIHPLYLREADAKPNASAALSSIIIRPATLADAPLLAELHGQCFESGWTVEMIAGSLALPGSITLIAELGGSTYGFVQAQSVAGEAEINTLCVLEPYRRQGFGRALMDALLADLRARATTRLFLEVAADNAAARAFYRNHGFTETGLRKAYYARPHGKMDAVTMARSL